MAFCSKNAHNFITQSRRDDLISLVYMLTYLRSGRLVYVQPFVPLVNQVDHIKDKKSRYTARQLCKRSNSMFLKDLCQDVYDLKFDEKPNYNLLRWYLQKNILDRDMAP